MAACPECDTTLVKPKRGPFPTYCSGSCRTKANQRLHRTTGRVAEWEATSRERRLAALPTLACVVCAAVIPRGAGRRTLCGEECARRWRAQQIAPHVHRRRARILGVDAEDFSPQEIYERDAWLCQLCGDPVDRSASFPAALMPSLDHIQPLSRGGAHTRSNAQLAHLGCNRRKGAGEFTAAS